MATENKKNIINVLYGIALFFALLGVAQLVINAINLLTFKLAVGGVGPVYNADFYKYTSQLCLTAAIISIVGLGLFIGSFFIKKNKILHIALIIFEGLIIIGLIVLTIISKNNIPQFNKYYWDYVSIYDFELFTSTQAMYVQQLIVFALLLIINVYRIFFKKNTAKLTETPLDNNFVSINN